jgi:hypothetical protein
MADVDPERLRTPHESRAHALVRVPFEPDACAHLAELLFEDLLRIHCPSPYGPIKADSYLAVNNLDTSMYSRMKW